MEDSTIEIVSPAKAREILEKNECGRRPNLDNVSSFAHRMKTGLWVPPTEVNTWISLSPEGALVDGQHRMMAVIEAGVDVTFRIRRNVVFNNAFGLG